MQLQLICKLFVGLSLNSVNFVFSCKYLLLKTFQKIFDVARGISGEKLFMVYLYSMILISLHYM